MRPVRRPQPFAILTDCYSTNASLARAGKAGRFVYFDPTRRPSEKTLVPRPELSGRFVAIPARCESHCAVSHTEGRPNHETLERNFPSGLVLRYGAARFIEGGAAEWKSN